MFLIGYGMSDRRTSLGSCFGKNIDGNCVKTARNNKNMLLLVLGESLVYPRRGNMALTLESWASQHQPQKMQRCNMHWFWMIGRDDRIEPNTPEPVDKSTSIHLYRYIRPIALCHFERAARCCIVENWCTVKTMRLWICCYQLLMLKVISYHAKSKMILRVIICNALLLRKRDDLGASVSSAWAEICSFSGDITINPRFYNWKTLLLMCRFAMLFLMAWRRTRQHVRQQILTSRNGKHNDVLPVFVMLITQ